MQIDLKLHARFGMLRLWFASWVWRGLIGHRGWAAMVPITTVRAIATIQTMTWRMVWLLRAGVKKPARWRS
jgi:hypothetical protein